jgi:hypothetical protein
MTVFCATSCVRCSHPPVRSMLGVRVLAQWRAQHHPAASAAAAASAEAHGVGGATATLGAHRGSRRGWFGITAGLAACAVVALAMWLQRPDPALDELMQADVLSQMALDEM